VINLLCFFLAEDPSLRKPKPCIVGNPMTGIEAKIPDKWVIEKKAADDENSGGMREKIEESLFRIK
jgi:hypothetical protein